MANVTTREAAISDAAAIARLITDLGYPTSADQMRLRLEALLADADYQTLVASVADVVVAFVGTRIGRFYEGDGLYGQIMALAVEPDHRRQGVGRLLLQAAESHLGSRGVQTLVVNSANHRADAHAFYESCGYRNTGRRFKKLTVVSV